MIPNVYDSGSSFRGALTYDLQPAKEPELLGGNMRGETVQSLAQEFGEWRALNPNVRKPVFHCSLSAAPGDQIPAERWLGIAGDFVERMGYGNSPWVAIRHHDTAIDHIHIVAARLDDTGRRVPGFREGKRSQAVCREIERSYDLQPLRSPALRARPTRGEVAIFEHTGGVTVKARLQEHIDVAARGRPTMRVFVERLEAQGIEVRARIADTGLISGISFAHDGVACKGSDLGRGYSWRQLQQRAGISYDASRDLDTLRAASARAVTRNGHKVPFAQGPAAPPLVPLDRPAEAFRQAAALVARTEISERHDLLAHQLAVVRSAGVDVRFQGDEGSRLDREVAAHRLALDHAMSRIYLDPAGAWRRLTEAIERTGVDATARTLEQRPADLGRLRGHAIGQLADRPRREAHAAAPNASRELRDFVSAAAAADAYRARAGEIALGMEASWQRARDLEALLRRLPDREALRQELVAAGRGLGTAAVQAVSATAARVYEAATRLVDRSRGRDHDRGPGRGDGGPGLER